MAIAPHGQHHGMEPLFVVFLIGILLVLGLFAYGLKQSPRGPGPPPRKSRNAFERFWDTPEHSDAWDEERGDAEAEPHGGAKRESVVDERRRQRVDDVSTQITDSPSRHVLHSDAHERDGRRP